MAQPTPARHRGCLHVDEACQGVPGTLKHSSSCNPEPESCTGTLMQAEVAIIHLQASCQTQVYAC